MNLTQNESAVLLAQRVNVKHDGVHVGYIDDVLAARDAIRNFIRHIYTV